MNPSPMNFRPMMRRTLLLAFAATLSAAAPLLHAQESAAAASAPQVDRTIRLDVVVTQKGSKDPVAGLTRQDFGLLDDGQPVAAPVTFREMHTGDQPARAILVVDALNIRLQGQQYVRDQVTSFLKSRPATALPIEVAILTDKGIQAQQGFSTDGPGMAAQLAKQPLGIRSIPQSTGIYGAEERFDLSLNGLGGLLARAATLPGRTLILWVSPGWPILSGVHIDLSLKQQQAIFARVVALSTAMRFAGVTLYAIDPIGAAESVDRSTYYENYLKPVIKPSQTDLGDQSLQVLAIQSGGLYLNSSAVGQMLDRAIADTTHYYEFTFPMAPVEKPDTFRSVYLKPADPNMTTRTRNGYYAQPYTSRATRYNNPWVLWSEREAAASQNAEVSAPLRSEGHTLAQQQKARSN